MDGYVHSIETFGTVDGPGIRYVVFLQGCPMRCLYCHNPDTWAIPFTNKSDDENACNFKVMSVTEILDDYKKYLPYLKNGGLTVTGGEPLLQINFVTELFREAKKNNIHTCLDTSGVTFHKSNDILEKFDILIQLTDLVMLDIKHIDDAEHKKLTSFSNKNILDFLEYLENKNSNVWIRHVVVPDITLKNKYLYDLGYHLGAYKNIKALDILPYHNLGLEKYLMLGLEYPLKDVPQTETTDAARAKDIILQGMIDRRNSNK